MSEKSHEKCNDTGGWNNPVPFAILRTALWLWLVWWWMEGVQVIFCSARCQLTNCYMCHSHGARPAHPTSPPPTPRPFIVNLTQTNLFSWELFLLLRLTKLWVSPWQLIIWTRSFRKLWTEPQQGQHVGGTRGTVRTPVLSPSSLLYLSASQHQGGLTTSI